MEINRIALNRNAGHPRNESFIDPCVIECSSKVMACGRDVARPGRANNDPRLSTLRYSKINALDHIENSSDLQIKLAHQEALEVLANAPRVLFR